MVLSTEVDNTIVGNGVSQNPFGGAQRLDFLRFSCELRPETLEIPLTTTICLDLVLLGVNILNAPQSFLCQTNAS